MTSPYSRSFVNCVLFHISRLAAVHPSSVLALGSALAGGVFDLLAHAGAPSGAHGASAARRLADFRKVRWHTGVRAKGAGAARMQERNSFNFFHNFYLGMHCR